MKQLSIAVVGAGVAGLSVAWLLSRAHSVTLIEAGSWAGGHANTVDIQTASGVCAVDTGFIVYNPPNYPNLCALFEHLNVPTKPAQMTFAVSMEDGAYEYSGTRLGGLFGQPGNLFKPAHWTMLADVLRFFRSAEMNIQQLPDDTTLAAFLSEGNFSEAFVRKHLLPMAAAIWSAPAEQMLAYPAKSFVRFFANHGLLKAANRPQWRTVDGGSREYVKRMLGDCALSLQLNCPVKSVRRRPQGVFVDTANGTQTFDRVILAAHADQSLGLLENPTARETELLGAFSYSTNRAVLHTDPRHMPQRQRIWSSWNYLSSGTDSKKLTVSYWMNSLQKLPIKEDVFITLNPAREIRRDCELARSTYEHPLFDSRALRAQKQLWSLQGENRTWYCGSYFGAGFHEDALQSGLAVAEDIGGVLRPWTVANESARIHRLAFPRRGQAVAA